MSSTVPRPPGPLHHPDPEGAVEAEVEVEAGDAAGCHPEGVVGATTMEARPGVGAAAAAGDAVARPASNFIGPGTNTWDQGPIWRNA